MASHRPITLRNLQGLWDRGENDSCPRDHLLDSLNMVFDGDDLKTRDGSTEQITLAGIKRIFEYKRIGEASRYLILAADGKLYDSTDLVTPILTIAAMTDFSFVNFFNRAYISPHDRVSGLSGENVQVYDGTGVARVAAGAAPSGSIITADGASGDIEAGTHLIAVAYESDSGYITVPGPTLFDAYVAPGAKKCDLSTVPTGPAGIAKRHILATKSIASYDGNQTGYVFYFVPGATITDNVTTTITIDFFDANLISDATYLFDQLTTLPAGLGLCELDGRLVLWGADGLESIVYISKAGEPESINSVDGFMVVDPTEAGIVTNCFGFRGSLVVCKKRRLYQATPTSSNAGYWPWISIDRGKGTTVFGLANIIDSRGTNLDYAIIADQSGVYLFDGVVREPDLTWKIRDFWRDRLNQTVLEVIQVAVDPVAKCIYIAVPLDSATEPTYILTGDFQNGLNHEKIRWLLWEFPVKCTSILVQEDATLEHPVLSYGSSEGNIYSIDSAVTSDDSVAIPDPMIKTSLLHRWKDGTIHHFDRGAFRVQGSGNLDISVGGLDDQNTTNLALIALAANPGFAEHRHINYEGERMYIKMSTNAIGETFTFSRLSVGAAFKWASRPIA